MKKWMYLIFPGIMLASLYIGYVIVLAKLRPDWVLVPVGYLNRFGFPHPDVLRRYHTEGAKVLDTANAGAISVEPGGDGPAAYRETEGKYWNARPDPK